MCYLRQNFLVSDWSGVVRQVQNAHVSYSSTNRDSSSKFGPIIAQLLSSTLRPSTNVQYQCHLQAGYDFITQHLGQLWILPLRVDSLAAFLVYLFQSGNSYSTIRTYVSALSYYHNIRSLWDPTKLFYIRKLLLGIKNNSSRTNALKPISKEILHRMILMLKFGCDGIYDQIMYKAIMLIMYYGCLSVGEALVTDHNSDHTLTSESVKAVYRQGQLAAYLIQFHSYKHQNVSSRAVKLQKTCQDQFCPVIALKQYLLIRPKLSGVLFIDGVANPVNRTMLVRVMKKVLIQANLDPANFGTYLFRVRRTTDLALEGVSADRISLLGRWESDAYLKYIRPACINLPS